MPKKLCVALLVLFAVAAIADGAKPWGDLSQVRISDVVAPATSGNVTIAEYNALVSLYYSTNGPSWNNSKYWLSGSMSPCFWYGVVCDPTMMHVSSLLLSANNLSGVLPVESLINLFQLSVLDVSMNLVGGPIPPSLGTMKSLSSILFSNNALVGEVPSSLGSLLGYSLRLFDASNNRLGGTLPSWIGVAPNYGVSVLLSGNPFACPIPPAYLYTKATCLNLTITAVQPNCYPASALVLVFGGPWPQQQLYCSYLVGARVVDSQPAQMITPEVLSCSTPSLCTAAPPAVSISDQDGFSYTPQPWQFQCISCIPNANITRKVSLRSDAQIGRVSVVVALLAGLLFWAF